MTTFELFVKRARIDLDAYFLANQISSDEQLREYCLRNNIQPPEKKYFQNEEPQAASVEVKTVAADSVQEVPPAEEQPVKKTRARSKTTKTSKPRTTKRTTRKKS